MTQLLATATDADPTLGKLILAGVVLLLVAGYVLACAAWPFVNCRRCEGNGKRFAWWGAKAFRLCRRCHGTGRRPRIGRRAWNYVRRLHSASGR